MGRSYSEYPFHEQQPMLGVQGSGPRLGNDEDKQKLGQQKAADLPDEGIHYRQPHAETIQRYQQKKAARARKVAAQAAGVQGGRRATAKKAPAAKKAPTAKKAAAKKAPMVKATPAPDAKKSAGRSEGAAAKKPSGLAAKMPKMHAGVVAKMPARGTKALSRVAVAAKTTVQRLAKKVGLRKSPKQR